MKMGMEERWKCPRHVRPNNVSPRRRARAVISALAVWDVHTGVD